MIQIIEDAKSVGAIVHSDGNVFFTNEDKLQAFADLQTKPLHMKIERLRSELEYANTVSFGRPASDIIAMQKDLIEQLESKVAMLRESASAQLERYRTLVNSGDAGNWDCEKEPEVVALVSAINATSADYEAYRNRIGAKYLRDAAKSIELYECNEELQRKLEKLAKQLEGDKE